METLCVIRVIIKVLITGVYHVLSYFIRGIYILLSRFLKENLLFIYIYDFVVKWLIFCVKLFLFVTISGEKIIQISRVFLQDILRSIRTQVFRGLKNIKRAKNSIAKMGLEGRERSKRQWKAIT